jgi:hypothetical protein
MACSCAYGPSAVITSTSAARVSFAVAAHSPFAFSMTCPARWSFPSPRSRGTLARSAAATSQGEAPRAGAGGASDPEHAAAPVISASVSKAMR